MVGSFYGRSRLNDTDRDQEGLRPRLPILSAKFTRAFTRSAFSAPWAFAKLQEKLASPAEVTHTNKVNEVDRQTDLSTRTDIKELSGALANPASIQEVTVEEFMDGGGEDAERVRRTEIKLYNRNVALMNIARMFGWVIERQEDTKSLEARLRTMTPEQREDVARSFQAQLQAKLREAAAETEATDAEGRRGDRR